MRIIEKKIKDIVPYAQNPRNNDDAVKFVANSIREFGFKVPVVLDRNNVIVAGHTRIKAAQLLQLDKVPCVIADDLTDEQVKAFRLADNKVSEAATWDVAMLAKELDELADLDFDMKEFNFDVDLDSIVASATENNSEEEVKVNERERTMEAYNLYDFDATRAQGFYQMPIITKTKFVPDELIGFNYMLTTEPRQGLGVHFYIDDYQFERVWNNPAEYIPRLSKFDCVLTPDFSLYTEMPMAMKIWNVYRSRLIGQMLQDEGATVIPTLSWCEPDTFEFCFEGIEPGGVVSVSTIGVKRDKEAYQLWKGGMDEAVDVLHPSCVVCYGGDVGYEFPCEVVYIENAVTERMKQ